MSVFSNISDIFSEGTARRTDVAKARIFAAVAAGVDGRRITRKTLAQSLSLRAATISGLVGELIEDRLIEESERIHPSGKGRPEVALAVRPMRIVVPAIQVASRTLQGVLVDITGHAVAKASTTLVDEGVDGKQLAVAFRHMADSLVAHRPDGAEVPGIGIALPGIVDEPGKRWISAARWPRMADLDFSKLAKETGLSVRIERNRQAELRAYFHTWPQNRTGSVLYVSWGYGISSAYAHNGEVLASSMGGFGDVGHWWVVPEDRRRCLCGQVGCLEAHAALWALIPEIRAAYPEVEDTPESIRELLRTRDVARLPGIERATRLFAVALHNLFKTFFPDRVVLSGYFMQNPALATRVRHLFFEGVPAYARDRVVMEIADPEVFDAIAGVTAPFFHESLRNRLIARNARI